MDAAQPGTVRIGYVRSLLDYLQAQHVDAHAVFDPSLLSKLQGTTLDARVPVSQWGTALRKAIDATADEHLPLKLAQSIIPSHWGVFAYAAMSCRNLGETAAMLVRYERTIDDVNDTQLQLEGDHAVLQWLPRLDNPHPALMQVSLASWVVFARRHTGQDTLTAQADFTCPPPADAAPFEALFGDRVRFGQPTTCLRFPLTYLTLPITYHDPESHRLLISRVIEKMDALQRPSQLHQQVKNLMLQHISHHRCTLENIAAELDLPARTLQHQLEQSGTTFRQLLDDTRTELARHYLNDPDMALVDVAFLLGFSEQSPFTKAFKRWTGETPGEYRANLLRAGRL